MANPNLDAYNALKQLGQGITMPLPGTAFQQPSAGMDPAVTLDALEQQRLREAQRNLQLAKLPGPPMMTGATPSTVSDLASDMATGDVAQSRATSQANEQALQQAALAGFPSPQTMAGAQRALETAKIMAPVQAERVKAAGALNVEQEKARLQQELQSGEFQNLMKLLHSQPGQGGSDMSGFVSLPSGSSFSFGKTRISTPPAIPGGGGAAYTKELMAAQDKLHQLETAPDAFDRGEDWLAQHGIGTTVAGMKTLPQRIEDQKNRVNQLQAQMRGTPYVQQNSSDPNAPPPEAMQIQPHQVYTDPTTGSEWLKTMSGQLKRIK